MTRKTICVLEGPDGSGKTTLAERLVAEGFTYGHRGAPEKPAVEYYKDGLRLSGGPIVLDRFHVGSYAYGKAFRGMDDLTDYERWTLEGMVYAQGGVMVYACPDQQVIERNLERGPDNDQAVIYEVPEKRLLVRQLFEEFMGSHTQLPLYRYDYMRPRAEVNVVNWVLYHQDAFGRQAMLPASVPALGNLVGPRLVFVADEPASRQRVLRAARQSRDPARFARLVFAQADWYDRVPFQACSSGRYLHLALTTAKLKLSDYCVFNSRLLCGEEVKDFLSASCRAVPGWDRARVVALGNAAYGRLRAAGVEVADVIPHPSYWKRFHYRDVFTYAGMLSRGVA